MGTLSVKDNLVCKEILKIQFPVFRGEPERFSKDLDVNSP